jgi:hypothetical protein
MKRLCSSLVLCFGLAGCASVSLEPEWLTQARGREVEPLPEQQIRSEDQFFRADVPARLTAPIDRQEDAYHARLDFGTEAAADCWVYREGLDTATALAAFSDATFEAISQTLGEVDYKRIEGVDAGAIGGSPFLSVDWLYRIGDGDSVQVGAVKHIAAQKGGQTVYCQHNELGYAETFRRLVRALVESLETAGSAAPEPYFTQISTLTIRDMRIGVEHASLTRDGAGDTRVDVRTSLLIPVNGDTLRTTDTFALEFAEPNGDLINQVHVETSDGELVSHLKLDPGIEGLWHVQGTFQTKPISAEIRPGDAPSSWLGEALTLRRTLAQHGVGSEVTLLRWVPQADPIRLLDEKLSIERSLRKNRYGAKLELAGLEAELVVDEKGSVAEGSMDMGFGSLDIERIYQSGAF